MILLYVFSIAYIFWCFYLMYSAFKAAQDAGRIIPTIAKWLFYPLLLAGLLLDVVYNATFGSLMFLEFPRTWTLTARCSSHLKEDGWRGAEARWLCKNLLDPFQTGGHCK